jgi:hypothetical protein
MLVELRFGSRVGTVADFPPHEARAMLADGRAVAVVDAGDDAPASITARLDARDDRGMPRGRRKATR